MKVNNGKRISATMWTRLYRLAMERGYLDTFLGDYIARPFLAVLSWCDRSERRWTDFLSGTKPDKPQTHYTAVRAVTLADDAP